MKKKVAGYLFFASWLLCGCSIETIFESPQSAAVTGIAMLTAILCAFIMGT